MLADVHAFARRIVGFEHVVEKHEGPTLRHLADGSGRRIGWPSTSSARGRMISGCVSMVHSRLSG
jgi:hypothetical protein